MTEIDEKELNWSHWTPQVIEAGETTICYNDDSNKDPLNNDSTDDF